MALYSHTAHPENLLQLRFRRDAPQWYSLASILDFISSASWIIQRSRIVTVQHFNVSRIPNMHSAGSEAANIITLIRYYVITFLL